MSKNSLRLMAWFGPWNPGREPGSHGEKHIDYTGIDITEGGTNIPYWMEDPEVRKGWDSMLEKEGVPSRMKPEYYEKNYLGELPQE